MVDATETRLRILCNDPEGASEVLSSAEYTALIEIESDVYRAAALACKSIASTFATKTAIKSGSISLDNQQKYEHYMNLASKYDARAREGGGGSEAIPYIGGVSKDAVEERREDTDRMPNYFYPGRINPDMDPINDDTDNYDNDY